MGYRIQYGPVGSKRRERKKKRMGLLVAICVVISAAVLHFSGLDTVIKTWLLPGDPEVTAAALQELVSDLQDGAGIGEAVMAFCEEIVDNAAYPQ